MDPLRALPILALALLPAATASADTLHCDLAEGALLIACVSDVDRDGAPDTRLAAGTESCSASTSNRPPVPSTTGGASPVSKRAVLYDLRLRLDGAGAEGGATASGTVAHHLTGTLVSESAAAGIATGSGERAAPLCGAGLLDPTAVSASGDAPLLP